MGIESELSLLVSAVTRLSAALDENSRVVREMLALRSTTCTVAASTDTPRPGSETEARAVPAVEAAPVKAPRAVKAKAAPVVEAEAAPVVEAVAFVPKKDELKRAALELITKLAAGTTPEAIASGRARVREMILAVEPKFTNVDSLPEEKYGAVWAAIQHGAGNG